MRWTERLGVAGIPRPDGPIAWLHGVSVGESLSLIPLAERILRLRPEAWVLFTSGTRASADILGARLGERMLHQYAPLDLPNAVKRFLDHWRPVMGVLVESEIWPNLILGARNQGARLVLASARMSARSAANWRRVPTLSRTLFGAFDLILARDAASADALTGLGARIDGLADFKFGAPPLPADNEVLDRVRAELGDRRIHLAASTHPGEDEIVLGAFRSAGLQGRAKLVIAPRHVERGQAVAQAARSLGFATSLRSTGAGLRNADVHVADTVGELGLWYRLARLAFIGGSLGGNGVGGHNPLEPARLDCPFISGPGIENWPIYTDLVGAAATALIRPDELRDWFRRAEESPEYPRAMAARASTFTRSRDIDAVSALDRVAALMPS